MGDDIVAEVCASGVVCSVDLSVRRVMKSMELRLSEESRLRLHCVVDEASAVPNPFRQQSSVSSISVVVDLSQFEEPQ